MFGFTLDELLSMVMTRGHETKVKASDRLCDFVREQQANTYPWFYLWSWRETELRPRPAESSSNRSFTSGVWRSRAGESVWCSWRMELRRPLCTSQMLQLSVDETWINWSAQPVRSFKTAETSTLNRSQTKCLVKCVSISLSHKKNANFKMYRI